MEVTITITITIRINLLASRLVTPTIKTATMLAPIVKVSLIVKIALIQPKQV